MPERFDIPGQIALRYRERAAEMRRQAVGVANAKLRRMLLEDAKLYDTLAEQAERNGWAIRESEVKDG